MYQPYVRGKQFELIGLRELIPTVIMPNIHKISPIIEPVKESSTLRTLLKEFAAKDVNFTIIVNPQVGTFQNTNDIFKLIDESINGYRNFQIGVIFSQSTKHRPLLAALNTNRALINSISIIHNAAYDGIDEILPDYQAIAPVKYNVINLDNINRRYGRRFDANTLIELNDFFKAQDKNSDYLHALNQESDFSEEHLYYRTEGFIGFSDFLSIGSDYTDSGFLPYAVAIHISYDDNQQRIKVKHFVSDSNDDTSDIGGKFAEALEKLIAWCNVTGFNSIVVPVFRKYHQTGHFPGLGTLKKLSLMNHIDVVLRLI